MSKTSDRSRGGRTYITQAVAAVLVVVAFILSLPTRVPEPEKQELASRFKFTRYDLPVEQLATGPLRVKHPLHPGLERISAWVSATGASVALGDLDGDGLPNDMCLTDPRLGKIVVLPVPGTGQRYEPFAPDPSPLPNDPVKMLPTGAVIGDFNEDGRPDLLVFYWGRTPVLYLRKMMAASVADDMAEPLGPMVFHPSELVPPGEDGMPLRWYTHAGTLADIDGDGHFDLVLGNFFHDGGDLLNPDSTRDARVLHAGKSKALNGGGAKLFMWQYATTGAEPIAQFADMSHVITDLTDYGWVIGLGAADLDNDMLPEIYFADDFGPDRLLHNRSTPGHPAFALAEGHRTLTTPKSCALGNDSFKGMGVGFADVNRDGFLDIYVSNIADDMALHESHFVWMSNGQPQSFQDGVAPYAQASEELGMSRSGWGWDSKFGDFDNDGDTEALQATGFIKGTVNRWPELQALGTSNDRIISDPRFWPKLQPGDDISGHNHNPFFVRGPEGRMVDVAMDLGMEETYNSRGIAMADVDGDGRLDFAIANQWEPSFFFKNESPRVGEFVGLHVLLPVEPNQEAAFMMRPGHPGSDTPGRPAIGACAVATAADGRPLVAQVDGGTGFAGRSSPQMQFGLGAAPPDKPLDVKLTWRDGHGQLHDHSISVPPGWYTVVLGSPSMKLSQK